MKHRPEIDGLRAVAVLPVIFYHAGFSLFSGGFIGVDVFFVISGYLITGIIFDDLRDGHFSIARFYERRARRILPALFAVLLASIPFAWLWMLPIDFKSFSESVVSVCLFASNILFWHQTGYFSTAAELKPLLHTWSLAVEEQYYILFPPMMIMVWKFARGWLLLVLLALGLTSFVLSEWMAYVHPEANFFLAPSRAWELMAGAVAVIWERKHGAHTQNALSIVGLAAILVAIVFFTKDTPIPSAYALLPVVGSVLVIMFARSGTITGRLLSLKPFVWVGLISYSAYLWHQPIFAFARIRSLYAPSTSEYLALIALSLIIAALSWRYVEAPWRGRTFSAKKVFILSPAVAVVFIGFGVSGYLSGGYPTRLPASVTAMLHYAKRDPRWDACNERVSSACVYGADTSPSFAVWGDSHAHALVPGLAKLAKANGVSFVLFSNVGCPSILGVYKIGFKIGEPGWCKSFNDEVMAELAKRKSIKTVILSSRYAVNLYGGTANFGPAETDIAETPRISALPDTQPTPGEAEQLFARDFTKTVTTLLALDKSVVLVEPVPEVGYNVPRVMEHYLLLGKHVGRFTRPYSYYTQRQRFIIHKIRALAKAYGLVVIRPEDKLCNGKRCVIEADGKPIYFDDNHLTIFGSEYISPLFAKAMTEVTQSMPPVAVQARNTTVKHAAPEQTGGN